MALLTEELKKQDIEDQLTWNDFVPAGNIRIEMIGDTVQLKGKVPDLAAKLAAERNVLMMAGVSRLESYIEVEMPPRITGPTDSTVTENILHVLKHDNRIKSENYRVETHKGVVTLTGSVSTFHEKRIASSIISNMKGVVDVKNRLAIILTSTVKDADIANSIRGAFRRNALINEEKVLVSVNNGKVRLTGMVPNHIIKRELVETTMHAKGIREIIDDVSIG